MAAWKLYIANRAALSTASYAMITNTEDASYPFSNCFDEDRLTVGKAADADDTVLRIDLAAAYSIDGWAFGYHTLGTQTATITLKYSTTDNSADAWATLTSADSCSSYTNNVCRPISSATKRYWWIGIEGQDAVAEIGEIALFDIIRTMSRNPSLPLPRPRDYKTVITETAGGAPKICKLGTTRRYWDITWRCLPRTTDLSYVMDDVLETYAPGRPFWFSDEYYDSVTDSAGCYMVVCADSDVSPSVGKRDLYDLHLKLREC